MRALLVRQAGSHRKECSSSSSGAAIRGHVLVRQSRTALTARPAAMTAPAPASHDTSDDMPAWVSALEARPGITQPNGHRYWEAKEEGTQPHGTDTIVAWLHEGSAPALRNARVYLDKSAKRVYGVMALGARVCGHPGIVHGGVTALMFDEMFGQAYWAWLAPTRGGGFTANLNVDYKAPLPARSWVCITVDMVGIEGRKVRLSATLSDRPHDEDGATVFATATCLFIVAAKDS